MDLEAPEKRFLRWPIMAEEDASSHRHCDVMPPLGPAWSQRAQASQRTILTVRCSDFPQLEMAVAASLDSYSAAGDVPLSSASMSLPGEQPFAQHHLSLHYHSSLPILSLLTLKSRKYGTISSE